MQEIEQLRRQSRGAIASALFTLHEIQMGDLFLLIINAALVNNLVLGHLVGVQDSVSFSKRLDVAWSMSIAVFCVISLSTPINHVVYKLIIVPFDLNYLAILIFMVTIFFIVQISTRFFRKILPIYQEQIATLTPLLLLNSVMIGAVLIANNSLDGFISSLFFGIGTGTGFGLVLLMFTCLRERIQTENVPAAFKSLPIILITLAIMSMAFTGLTGIGA